MIKTSLVIAFSLAWMFHPVINLGPSPTVPNSDITVLKIVGPTGAWGSGSVISEDGWVVTAKHVAALFHEGDTVNFYTKDGKQHFTGKVMKLDKDHDDSLMKIDNVKDMKFLKMAESGPKAGDLSYIWGYSHNKLAGKTVRYIGPMWTSNGDDQEYSGGIDHGDSGGPILNKNNEIIGVGVAKTSNGDRSIGVSIDDVKKILPDSLDPTPYTEVTYNASH